MHKMYIFIWLDDEPLNCHFCAERASEWATYWGCKINMLCWSRSCCVRGAEKSKKQEEGAKKERKKKEKVSGEQRVPASVCVKIGLSLLGWPWICHQLLFMRSLQPEINGNNVIIPSIILPCFSSCLASFCSNSIRRVPRPVLPLCRVF